MEDRHVNNDDDDNDLPVVAPVLSRQHSARSDALDTVGLGHYRD